MDKVRTFVEEISNTINTASLESQVAENIARSRSNPSRLPKVHLSELSEIPSKSSHHYSDVSSVFEESQRQNISISRSQAEQRRLLHRDPVPQLTHFPEPVNNFTYYPSARSVEPDLVSQAPSVVLAKTNLTSMADQLYEYDHQRLVGICDRVKRLLTRIEGMERSVFSMSVDNNRVASIVDAAFVQVFKTLDMDPL